MVSKAETQRLKKVKIVVKRGKRRFSLNAYSVTDVTFLRWIVAELGGVDNRNRLKFRLAVLGILERLRIKGTMKRVIPEDVRKVYR